MVSVGLMNRPEPPSAARTAPNALILLHACKRNSLPGSSRHMVICRIGLAWSPKQRNQKQCQRKHNGQPQDL